MADDSKKQRVEIRDILIIFVYLYLTLPILIFLFTWLRWYWALPFGVLAAMACGRVFMDTIQKNCIDLKCPFKGRTVVYAVILIALWVYLSGIGGYCYQNSDHNVRNSIFHALVDCGWPVRNNAGNMGLVYYIGFWLPAACVGKVFGLEAGYAAQYIWAVLGVCIVYYLICVYRQKIDLLPILFLFFFSGLDYAGTWILGEKGVNLSLAMHLEGWSYNFQYSSTTTQLFWVFNQALPAWIATMLILLQKDCKSILFILSLIMLTSTLPFVGLIPIAIYVYIKCIGRDKNRWAEIVTFQNIVGVNVIGVVCFHYLSGNVSGSNITQYDTNVVVPEPAARILQYLLFFFFEFGIYLWFIWQYHKRDRMTWIITGMLICCPFIQVGFSGDFCMRASIPALFILMLYCMDVLERFVTERKKYIFVTYSIVLLIGAITPFNELHRTVNETFWRVTRGESVRQQEVTLDELLLPGNFSGSTNNFFYKYLAKP